MKTQHTDPAEALQIAIDLGAQHLLGVHWATFQLTDEPWDEPAKLLESADARPLPRQPKSPSPPPRRYLGIRERVTLFS